MRDSRTATLMSCLGLPARWFYRVRQFVRAVLAHVTPDEMLAVTEILPRPGVALFVEMPLDAQRHSLDVLYALESRARRLGQPLHPALAAAGLLHDVGKIAADRAGRAIRLWLRGPLVLWEAVAPRRLARYADPRPESGWRYLVHVHLAHPHLGAEMAANAGLDELTCWLIARHQESPATLRQTGGELSNPDRFSADEEALGLLAALRWADRRN